MLRSLVPPPSRVDTWSSVSPMRPTYSAEAEAYREKVQAFLAEKLPANWKGIGALDGDELETFIKEWRVHLAQARYLAPGWPAEFGGGGLSALEQVIVAEEFTRAGVPKEVTARLNADIHAALGTPALRERLVTAGMTPVGGTPEQFTTMLKADADGHTSKR